MLSNTDERGRKPRNKSRCNVEGCSRQLNFAIHSVPAESSGKLRRLWLSQLKINSLQASRFYVSGNHFRPEDYRDDPYKIRSRRILKGNAIPSLNLPNSKDESLIDQELAKVLSSNHNEFDVDFCKTELLPEYQTLNDNKFDVEIENLYKKELVPEGEMPNCDRLTFNDELMLGL